MEQSKIKILQICWQLSDWEERRNLIKKTFDMVNPRMTKLWNNELYLETVLVNSQVLEIMIKTILQGYKVKRNILKILSEEDPYVDEKFNETDDEPLGSLIGTLRRFTGKIPLIEKLSRFNNGLRKEVAHHIFDAMNSKKVEVLEEEIKNYFKGYSDISQFREVTNELKSTLNKVDKEIKEISKIAQN